ncbi:hypothetical protein B0H10DRAFT_1941624 [Mycena sp. CBHHK59/15]|nr:hypothetical protein B0H10DRAFT_1941624 [Mycena sp. CBHHK59/15]
MPSTPAVSWVQGERGRWAARIRACWGIQRLASESGPGPVRLEILKAVTGDMILNELEWDNDTACDLVPRIDETWHTHPIGKGGTPNQTRHMGPISGTFPIHPRHKCCPELEQKFSKVPLHTVNIGSIGLARAAPLIKWWTVAGVELRLAVQMEEHLDARAQWLQNIQRKIGALLEGFSNVESKPCIVNALQDVWDGGGREEGGRAQHGYLAA